MTIQRFGLEKKSLFPLLIFMINKISEWFFAEGCFGSLSMKK
jgi:hypothetical protein